MKHPDSESDIDDKSILECIKAIKEIQEKNALILDDAGIIFN
jgi:hypothetical protein